MTAAHARRLERLEAARPAPTSILAPHALDRMTDDELREVERLLLENGDPPRAEALPADALARVMILVGQANSRDPAPCPSSSPAYAAWAEHARAGLPEQ